MSSRGWPFLLWGLLASAAFAATPEDIQALLAQGKANEAYELGKTSPNLLGAPMFDFYFGVAAIDSGHGGEGVLALERYVMLFPDNVNARLELARGYFVVGDDVRAREEFEIALKSGPPPAVRTNIERFLDALRARESNYKVSSALFVEGGIGYDNNVNASPGSANIALNGVPVVLGAGSVKAGSGYTHYAAGGRVSRPLAPGLGGFLSAQVDGKFHNANNGFDQNSVAGSGGLTYLRNDNYYSASASYSSLKLDDQRFRDTASFTGEWSRQLDQVQSVNAFVQVAQLAYTRAVVNSVAVDNSARDSNFYSTGAGYRRAFTGAWQPLVSVNAYVGAEETRNTNNSLGNNGFSRNVYGARASLAVTPLPKWALSLGGSYQSSRYRAPDPATLATTSRSDGYYALDATASYAFTRNLSVRGELVASRNDSNISLYEFNRNVFAVKLRYDFK